MIIHHRFTDSYRLRRTHDYTDSYRLRRKHDSTDWVFEICGIVLVMISQESV
jgi:hypothetical protein